MTVTLQPAKTLAKKMDKTAIDASKVYRPARTALLTEEIELRRHMERSLSSAARCRQGRR